MKYGEEADYNPSYEFTEDDFRELMSESMNLQTKIVEYLKRKGQA